MSIQLTAKSLFEVVQDAKITSPRGFTAAGVHSGVKRKSLDLGAIICAVPATAAAVYTTNAFQAPPLKVTQESIGVEGKLKAFVVNSGIANACTGERGLQDAYQMRQKTAELLGIPPHQVGVVSTGVIGEYLPMEKVLNGLERVVNEAETEGGELFAKSILTTDTCTKKVEVSAEIDGKEVKIAGVAKGSGMIHPNMATMLGFVTTDAVIDPNHLQSLLWQTTDETFNMITVDGDCSTNDMVVAMASGLAGNHPLHPQHPDWKKFQSAFSYVCQELAKKIARDGEGATRLIEVKVDGASSVEMARKIAKSIVGSSLVKSAVFGADANWGRILCAAGYGDPIISPDSVDVCLGPVSVVKGGLPAEYDEAAASEVLKQEKVEIYVSLNMGEQKATAWGCDLTYDYVKINASYRT
ncbi:bifunctional glutamate N-acetyltransferase/amino-acid acetyltransferase ArgJ [Paenactinomyces guangxiensis]|uniref:Arginine biosynthesis bifunctional protein ArgJ n=1 Tax=Paenactinomyces guangxiensis TaxID=1490290 RepID=A0A7W1WSQ7_9BACL|nr:bifunctional glutamate N-acetyltransferase/amino-acid acetyltransferase ArgJ [Paenactinomyces guangxiensis]MBA4495351.1 bifunctional glutamate N-acetyltransferase/amino-acid acetyltransferase ArgJ [Paenactinomyces guangxiensis]MBH8592528.1 bifunctional glutamate N-acetyltransferase/amino-acid acetyltransferase ArgJ [Paenactinomyces guangxiensis]